MLVTVGAVALTDVDGWISNECHEQTELNFNKTGLF